MIDRTCHLFANVDQNSWNTRHQMWNSPPHWNANGLHLNFHFQPTLNWTMWIFEKFPSVLKDQRNILEKKPVPPCNPIQDQGRSSFPNLNLLFTRKSSGKVSGHKEKERRKKRKYWGKVGFLENQESTLFELKPRMDKRNKNNINLKPALYNNISQSKMILKIKVGALFQT